jgi:hypothetical protein
MDEPSMTISDNTGYYTLTINNGKKRFKAKDTEGEELFNGPMDTDKQRNALDRDLIKKLEQLEGMGKGKGEGNRGVARVEGGEPVQDAGARED